MWHLKVPSNPNRSVILLETDLLIMWYRCFISWESEIGHKVVNETILISN